MSEPWTFRRVSSRMIAWIGYVLLTIAFLVAAVFVDEGVLKTHRIYPFCKWLGIADPISRVLRSIF
jgi:hypothetical protein